MAYFYMDTDVGSDANDGTTWALSKLTIEGLLTVMAAGDTGFSQGATVDTVAAARTLTPAGTIGNPIKIIGVKDGTTNTGAGVVTSDLIVRGTDTLVKIETTGSNNLIFGDGSVSYSGIEFATGNQINYSGITHLSAKDCKFTLTADWIALNVYASYELNNCEIAMLLGSDLRHIHMFHMMGGIVTGSPSILIRDSSIRMKFTSVNLSTITTITNASIGGGHVLKNCLMPSSYTVSGGTLTTKLGVELVGCNSNTAAKGSTTSYQDYYYEDVHGTVEDESVVVRTGGADDGATGLFSYAMTPKIDRTLEGSNATLKSPWLNVWLAGGANTLTVYISNGSASTDFNQDEVWVEFYTPDSGDTAQHDQTFDPANARLLDSSAIIADDTGSTWGTGGNNHQKLSITVTTGFEGFGYARLHYAKRFAATPVTLYLDPKIAVT